MEVRNEAYFCPFVLALVEDASGGEVYYYGRQGEVTKTVRTVMASVADIRTYVYGATYDSWNRVQTMTYPDGEVVTYHYNAAGQVKSLTSSKQGKESTIVAQIGYDKDGHTVYQKLGNGTETTYTYDKQRERLQDMTLTGSGSTLMQNKYRYDAVDNILGITNAANPQGCAQRRLHRFDETYFKILVPEKNSKGKGVKKGYFWVIVGQKSGLLYVVYRDGSRAGDVIYDELHGYHGTMHSDAASFYRKIQGDDFPNITRIACLQHIKRKFIDCMDAEPEAKEMVKLINKLYHEEHKHKIGENSWTVKDNFKWRQQYAPAILAEIKAKLDGILNKPDLLPDSELSEAASYFNNEWEAVVDIFKRGDTALDNNLVERMNRYFSMSRRSSLFFGSHKGAERAAVLYTLALSAKMNHLNLFDYLVDILDRTATWQPNTPLEKYRNLLPDCWQPSTED